MASYVFPQCPFPVPHPEGFVHPFPVPQTFQIGCCPHGARGSCRNPWCIFPECATHLGSRFEGLLRELSEFVRRMWLNGAAPMPILVDNGVRLGEFPAFLELLVSAQSGASVEYPILVRAACRAVVPAMRYLEHVAEDTVQETFGVSRFVFRHVMRLLLGMVVRLGGADAGQILLTEYAHAETRLMGMTQRDLGEFFRRNSHVYVVAPAPQPEPLPSTLESQHLAWLQWDSPAQIRARRDACMQECQQLCRDAEIVPQEGQVWRFQHRRTIDVRNRTAAMFCQFREELQRELVDVERLRVVSYQLEAQSEGVGFSGRVGGAAQRIIDASNARFSWEASRASSWAARVSGSAARQCAPRVQASAASTMMPSASPASTMMPSASPAPVQTSPSSTMMPSASRRVHITESRNEVFVIPPRPSASPSRQTSRVCRYFARGDCRFFGPCCNDGEHAGYGGYNTMNASRHIHSSFHGDMDQWTELFTRSHAHNMAGRGAYDWQGFQR